MSRATWRRKVFELVRKGRIKDLGEFVRLFNHGNKLPRKQPKVRG
jgi:hypothetical protein